MVVGTGRGIAVEDGPATMRRGEIEEELVAIGEALKRLECAIAGVDEAYQAVMGAGVPRQVEDTKDRLEPDSELGKRMRGIEQSIDSCSATLRVIKERCKL